MLFRRLYIVVGMVWIVWRIMVSLLFVFMVVMDGVVLYLWRGVALLAIVKDDFG